MVNVITIYLCACVLGPEWRLRVGAGLGKGAMGAVECKNGNWGVPRAERVREHVLKEVSAHDLTKVVRFGKHEVLTRIRRVSSERPNVSSEGHLFPAAVE